MVAPILLGILGAGLASQAAVHGWAIPEFKKRQGKRAGGILDDLGEDASIDQKRQALMQGGLLDPEKFAQIGFDDQASNRDFFESLRLNQANNQAAMDRTHVGQAGQDRRQQIGIDAIANENALDRTEKQRAYSSEQWQEADDQFWAVANTLETDVQPINQNITDRNRALEIIKELRTMTGPGRAWDRSLANSLKFELAEIDNDLFYSAIAETYGDREPSPETLKGLRQGYKTFTGADGSLAYPAQWDEIEEQYIRRNAEDARTVEGALIKAQDTVKRLNENFNTRFPDSTSWSLGDGEKFRVHPQSFGGGLSDSDVDEDE